MDLFCGNTCFFSFIHALMVSTKKVTEFSASLRPRGRRDRIPCIQACHPSGRTLPSFKASHIKVDTARCRWTISSKLQAIFRSTSRSRFVGVVSHFIWISALALSILTQHLHHVSLEDVAQRSCGLDKTWYTMVHAVTEIVPSTFIQGGVVVVWFTSCAPSSMGIAYTSQSGTFPDDSGTRIINLWARIN